MSESIRKMVGLILSIISIFLILAGLYAGVFIEKYSILLIFIGVILLTTGIVFFKIMCDN